MPNNTYFYHHGIEGQKWGKRHGPPYPLQRDSKGRVKRKYSLKDAEDLKKTYNISDAEMDKAVKHILYETDMSSIKEYAKIKKLNKRMQMTMHNRALTGMIGTWLYQIVEVKTLQMRMNSLNERAWKRVYDEALTSIIEDRLSKTKMKDIPDINQSNKKKLRKT